jgi:hypothetical protein
LIDKNPELQNTHPKGYEEGHTYKQSPAIFDGYSVVVCEYTMDPDTDALEPCGDALGSVRHEFGHAVDRYLGQLSETPEYKHAYYLDLGRVSEEDKVKLNYYCQKAERGLHECFAEVYSGITGGPASDDKWRVEQNQGVMANFKGVRGFIDGVLKQMDR